LEGRYLALLRGLNVGRGNRLAMAELRAVVAGCGLSEVGTVLASGNVAFTAPGGMARAAIAPALEGALAKNHGLRVRVTVVSAAELAAVIDEAPLAEVADDPSRLLVGFARVAGALAQLRPLTTHDWSPAALEVTPRAAWLWCPNGVLKDALFAEVNKAMGEDLTTRNWTTLQKLPALLAGER
jgi:uncharacterized protein (DUF1697 family)